MHEHTPLLVSTLLNICFAGHMLPLIALTVGPVPGVGGREKFLLTTLMTTIGCLMISGRLYR